jgi:ABC-type spermidine/putrescine transport system permease subunit I
MRHGATIDQRAAPDPARTAPWRQLLDVRPAAWLLSPALVLMVVFFALPLSTLVWASFHIYEPGSIVASDFTLKYYVAVLTDPHYLRIMGTSLRVATLATLVCLVIGYPVAYLMAISGRTRPWLQIGLLVVVFTPLFVGVVVRAFAWTVLLRSDGLVNNLLLGLGLIDAPIRLLFTETGLVIALTHVFLPLMILPIASVIQKIDPNLDEAARTLGAPPLARVLKVLLPLSLPGISAGCAMVFCMSISAYVIPTLVAGGRLLVMPVVVAKNFMVTMEWSAGAAMAVMLVLLTTTVVAVNTFFFERRSRLMAGPA